MQARASLRRSARVSRDSDPISSSPQSNQELQKLKLPSLRGTPSSRRQYSYGAAAEPLPTRPGRGLQGGQMIDLGSAVRNVLTRQEHEDSDELGTASFTRPRPAVDDRASEDELAAEEPSYRPANTSIPSRLQPPQLAFSRQGQASESSDADDARSFGIESDYYGDATIASTPASMAPPGFRDIGSAAPTPRTQQSRPTRQTQLSQPQDVPEDAISEPRQPSTTLQDAAQVVAQRSAKPTATDVDNAAKPKPSQRRRRRNVSEVDELSGEEPQEEEHVEVTSKRSGFRYRGKNPTAGLEPTRQNDAGPSPKKGRPAASARPVADNTKSTQLGRNRTTDVGSLGGDGIRAEPNDSRETDELQSLRGGRRLNINPSRTSGPNLFERARGMALKSSPFSRPQHPSHHSEQDATFQGDILRELREAEREREREERQRAREESRRATIQRWRERWAWLKSMSPLTLFPARRQQTEARADERDLGRDDAIDWWELFYPWTYVEALIWLVGAVIGGLTGLGRRIFSPYSQHLFVESVRYAMYIGGALTVAIFALSAASAMFTHLQENPLKFPTYPTDSISWDGFGDVATKVREYIPSIHWPTFGRWDGLPDFEGLDDIERSNIDRVLKQYEKQLSSLTKAANLDKASIEKLEAVLPKVVHMDVKDGKPVVTQAFFHALLEMAKEDGSIIMMEKNRGGYEFTSDEQWQAIISKLDKDPRFISRFNRSVGQLEDQLDNKMASSWDAWVKNNNDKVSDMLGTELDKIQLAGSDREFDRRLGKIVKEHLDAVQPSSTVVTRDEFLRHLKNEFTTHRAEIHAELDDLKAKTEAYMSSAMKDPPKTMSAAEITALVERLVQKQVSGMKLEAMAKGKIHAHWEADLKNHVNYFNGGTGATVNIKLSSQTYNPVPKQGAKKGVVPNKIWKHGVFDAKPPPHMAALMPWEDEGDCWCAARSVNHRGNPHGAQLAVQLAHTIIPQHLVVDHILPGATTDSDARPKDIEVYADIDDSKVRERVRDFSSTSFPDRLDDWNSQPAELPAEFIKIGAFRYEGAELHDGIFVYQFSSELKTLGAETNQVVVRAVSNYGAKEHTCFYRVRLFGDRVVEAE